jgi:TonB dependent receptor/TonB-dependent Receptor Plug Domain
MRCFLLCCFSFLGFIPFSVFSQTLSGYVFEKESQETIAGSTIRTSRSQAVVTNNEGFFQIEARAGDTISVSMLGYLDTAFIRISGQDWVEIWLSQSQLEVVEVNAARNELQFIGIGKISLSMEEVRIQPQMLGLGDPLQALILQPGVSGGREGMSGLFIRGGTPDQTILYMDGMPVYNGTHLFGFASVFNSSILSKVDLYKSGIPARYGGMMSGIVDVINRDGDRNKTKNERTTGLIESSFMNEGPWKKTNREWTSISSGRLFYPTLIALAAFDGAPLIVICDGNLKLSGRKDDGSILQVSGFVGQDLIQTRESVGDKKAYATATWGNQNISVSYVKPVKQGGYLELLAGLAFSQSFRKGSAPTEAQELFLGHKRIVTQDLSSMAEMRFHIRKTRQLKGHLIQFGMDLNTRRSVPTNLKASFRDRDSILYQNKIAINSLASGLFIQDDWRINTVFVLTVGARLENYLSDNAYFPKPLGRFSLGFFPSKKATIKISYDQTWQPIHFVSPNTIIHANNGVWLPATKKLKPQNGDQISIGLACDFNQSTKWQIEAYGKRMRNQVDFKDGAFESFFNQTDQWESVFEANGFGRAFGLENSLSIQRAKYLLNIGATFSINQRKFEQINEGNWYYHSYDRRVDLEMMGNYKLNKSSNLSATWVYATGSRVSIPTAVSDDLKFFYEERNAFILPSTHHLDLMFINRKVRKDGKVRTWKIGIYNVYGRPNPFSFRISTEPNPPNGLIIKGETTSYFMFLPIISYSKNW